MKILIDGKEVTVGNDVKVIWEKKAVSFDGETEVDVHLTLRYEGIICDVINHKGEVEKTCSILAEDITETLPLH